ncbi:MAG: phosphoribosylanthranilate isomerase [Bryobacteraceae bacterium]|jgi:phosphoribosylanthranilate isomerase
MIVKVCGITNAEDAAAAIAGGANAIGFNFYAPSPRYIAPERAAEIPTETGVRRVGVFVNESRARVEEIARIAGLDVAQLHGDETVDNYPAAVTVWKAARMSAGFSFASFTDSPAEALLLDGPAGVLYGGAGLSFDWSVGQASWPVFRRIILAGGLDASNVEKAVAIARPWGVDACSRIESSPGKKDHKKMLEFVRTARRALESARRALELARKAPQP